MPKVCGIEFLSICITNNEDIKHIPTVILTTSEKQKGLDEFYRIGFLVIFYNL
jgi:hypothetical protein